MTSQKKLSSNRLNAQKSTGPKTAQGKARSRYNALKNGIYAVHRPIPGEDHQAYRRLSRRLTKHYAPSDPVEELIVDQILGHIWRMQRLERAEKAYLQAIDETRCNRQVQCAFELNALVPQDDGARGSPSKPHLLGNGIYTQIEPNSHGQVIDDLSGTFLEASIARAETQPLAELMARRASHLDEIFWLESNLKCQRGFSFKSAMPKSRTARSNGQSKLKSFRVK